MLDRVVNTHNPGQQWQGRSVHTGYLTNSGANGVLPCRRFSARGNTLPILTDGGYYPANALFVTQTIDEGGQTSYIFTDGAGRQLLQRQMADGVALDTYSVYNDQGDLCFVLQPALGQSAINQENIDLYAFQYRYDLRHRCLGRKIPGAGWTTYVYDAADHLVLSQDSEQHSRNEWTCSFPDAMGRNVVTGIIREPVDIPAWQSGIVMARFDDGTATPTGYIADAPVSLDQIDILSVVYYDNYDFLSLTGFDGLDYVPAAGYGSRWKTNADRVVCKGLQTGSKLAVLSQEGYTYNATYYDYYMRPVQQQTKLHNGGRRSVYTAFDFSGNTTAEQESITPQPGAATDMLIRHYTYDHAGRMLSERTTLNGGDPSVVEYTYDEFGRPTVTSVGEGSNTIKTTRKYNIRGWLLEQDNAYFSMQLNYLDPKFGPSEQGYTGNIVEWSWRHTGSDETNTYRFTYDGVSRLTDSRLYTNNTLTDNYSERGLDYDPNGNLRKLKRISPQSILSYTYTYTGNRLTTLTESPRFIAEAAGQEIQSGIGQERKIILPPPIEIGQSYSYAYDQNGNMTDDGMNGLHLSYNHLNLVKKVEQNSATVAKYTYLSDGTKVEAVNGGGKGFAYLGSLVYTKQGDNLTLESAAFSGGRFVSGNTGFTPYYYLTDHLGSVRAIVNKDNIVQEQNDYYPFGLRYNTNGEAATNRYLYNGKEEQAFVNLPYSDYGARQYDPLTGRWFNVDPLAEKFRGITPYAFCGNNPLKFIDSDGRSYYVAVKTGEIINIPGNADLSRSGYHYLGADDAKVHEIKENYALYQARRQAKAQFLMAIFSPDNVGTILALAGSGGAPSRGISRAFSRRMASSTVWEMSPLERGWAIERRLGGWGNNFPVIDKFGNGIATSIKSLDMNAKTYQKPGAVFNKIKGYIDDLAGFIGGGTGANAIEAGDITGKSLELALPTGSGSTAQWDQIRQAIQYALNNNIDLKIKFIR